MLLAMTCKQHSTLLFFCTSIRTMRGGISFNLDLQPFRIESSSQPFRCAMRTSLLITYYRQSLSLSLAIFHLVCYCLQRDLVTIAVKQSLLLNKTVQDF